MRSSRLADILLIVGLLGTVAVGLYMSLGKSVQARVGAATQKMVGEVHWANSDKFPELALIAFHPSDSHPSALLDGPSQNIPEPDRLAFFAIPRDALKKGEELGSLQKNDPRLSPVSADGPLAERNWQVLWLEKRSDGSFVLTSQAERASEEYYRSLRSNMSLGGRRARSPTKAKKEDAP